MHKILWYFEILLLRQIIIIIIIIIIMIIIIIIRRRRRNHIIIEYSKLAQKKYKSRHNWVGKVIHSKLYKILQFDYADK